MRTREQINAKRRSTYAKDPSKRLAATKRWREENPDYTKSYNKEQRERVRDAVVEAYGGKCSCCGESEKIFLTIDHIFNDGAKHQRRLGLIGKAGVHIYRDLQKQGFPQDRYRLLCYNCNCGRARNGGVCPHEERKS